jgi:hypothetical protein
VTGQLRVEHDRGFEHMNRYVIIGIVAIAIGTIVMTGLSNKPAWMIFGGVINGLGLFVMTAGVLNSSKKDKAEIVDRIRREFRGQGNFGDSILNVDIFFSFEGISGTVY